MINFCDSVGRASGLSHQRPGYIRGQGNQQEYIYVYSIILALFMKYFLRKRKISIFSLLTPLNK